MVLPTSKRRRADLVRGTVYLHVRHGATRYVWKNFMLICLHPSYSRNFLCHNYEEICEYNGLWYRQLAMKSYVTLKSVQDTFDLGCKMI